MKTPVFDHIAIIFNPISTGDAPRMAKDLAKAIEKRIETIGIKPTLTPTKYARHGEELAENIGLKYKRPLIVSVSGDGGYNEVVNGALKAKAKSKKAQPVVAVVGAGNANDHRRVMRDEPLIKLIVKAKPKTIDLIHLTVKSDAENLERYAHSYIGLGISPEVAVELNRHSLSLWREVVIVCKAFMNFRPFKIIHKDVERRADSIIFANINEMAKVLKLKETLDVTDDRFEVVEFRHENKVSLLYHLLKAAIVGVKNAPEFKSYECHVIDAEHIQLDGEVHKISPAGTDITVKSVHQAIDVLS